jgi:hypothetical protein
MTIGCNYGKEGEAASRRVPIKEHNLMISQEAGNPDDVQSAYFVLVDTSLPVDDRLRLAFDGWIKQIRNKVCFDPQLPRPVCFAMAVISHHSVGKGELLFQTRFDRRVPKILHRMNAQEMAMKEQLNTISAGIESIPQYPSKDGTEIIAAMDIVGRFMSRYPRADKVLYIFSDMIEQSSVDPSSAKSRGMKHGWNFEPQGQPNSQMVQSILNDPLVKQCTLGLADTRIIVRGATSDTSEHALLIRNFWLRLFAQAHASCSLSDFGAESFPDLPNR